jgi:hypothetical protein
VEVIKRLIWMKNTLAPVLAQCLEALNGIELLPIVQEALRMGDELHMRNHAASMLMNRLIHSVLFKLNYPMNDLHEVSLFLQRNPFFFLNLSMALAKLYLQSFEGKEGPPVVTACGANGNEIGFQISTEPGQWYTEQSPVSLSSVQIEGPLSPAIGDSFVVEVFGMGGRLTSLSPSLWESLGIRTYEQIAATEEALKKVAVGTLFEGVPFNPLHWQGIAIGLDAEKMAQGEVPLVINTAVLHRQGGIRGIGRVYIPNEWMRKVLKNGKKMG